MCFNRSDINPGLGVPRDSASAYRAHGFLPNRIQRSGAGSVVSFVLPLDLRREELLIADEPGIDVCPWKGGTVMAWQRKTPFGYMVRGGETVPCPTEADAVQNIFTRYLAGASFGRIAEEMSRGEQDQRTLSTSVEPVRDSAQTDGRFLCRCR